MCPDLRQSQIQGLQFHMQLVAMPAKAQLPRAPVP